MLGLFRVGMGCCAVSNIWLMIRLAEATEGGGPSGAYGAADGSSLGPGLALILGAAVGFGLHVYGVALNDVLDARHDHLFHPTRPLARGALPPTAALVASLIGLILAVLAAIPFGVGSTVIALIMAAGILFFNGVAKFLPALGLLTLALLRAALMLLPHPDADFLWPVLLNVTLLTAASALAYRWARKRPVVGPAGWLLAIAAWMFFALTLVLWMSAQSEVWLDNHPRAWIGPALTLTLAAAGAAVFAARRPRRRPRRLDGTRLAAVTFHLIILIDASWLIAVGDRLGAASLIGLFLLALAADRWLVGSPLSPGPRRSGTRRPPLRYRISPNSPVESI